MLSLVLCSGCAFPGGRLAELWDKTPSASEVAQTPAARAAQAQQFMTQGKLTESRKLYEQLIVEEPENPDHYHRLGRVADLERRHREATALYGEAIRLKPQSAELFNDLGYSLYLQGQLLKAESALLKALALAPSNQRFHNNLGLIYGQEHRYGESLQQFRLAGSEADAQYNLAFILSSQDDAVGAKRCFQAALVADPKHEKSRSALKAFERYEKDPEGAMDMGEVVENGVRWVPYVEPAAGESAVQQASATTESTGGTASSSQDTSGKLRQAQSMMRERMMQQPQ
jgi:tetratricopeptide (TPR) repeat protein